MRLTRTEMFLLLNGSIAFGLAIYFGTWMFSRVITGQLAEPYFINKVTVVYKVDGITYKGTYLRNDISYTEKNIPIRYKTFNPSRSRINSFMGMWAEPLAWWSVFLLASSALLIINNTVFSKGTVFRIQKKFPWISMEEYFPFYDDSGEGPTRRDASPGKKISKRIGRGNDD